MPLTDAAPEDFFPVATVSSTIVFHSPQAGQRPIHLGASFPHEVQNQDVFIFPINMTGRIKSGLTALSDSFKSSQPKGCCGIELTLRLASHLFLHPLFLSN